MADETRAARITCDRDDAGKVLEGVVDTDVYLPLSVEWDKVPFGALAFVDGSVSGKPATQPATRPGS